MNLSSIDISMIFNQDLLTIITMQSYNNNLNKLIYNSKSFFCLQVSIEVLRKKILLLYITDLHHISDQEVVIFEQMYQESRQDSTRLESQYELIWIPIVEKGTVWTKTKQKFEKLQSMMPWYSVYDPSLLEPASIRYIKEVWLFNTKPMLVVLDPQGKVVNLNAIHMMWIWGSMAYPFSSLREEALWKDETWGLALLADTIDPLLFDWVSPMFFILCI